MKKTVFYFLILCLSVFVIPAIVVTADAWIRDSESHSIAAASGENIIKIYNTESGSVTEMDFEKYLIGAVSAQMDPNSPKEALKAQAVASRSYLLDKIKSSREGKNEMQHKGCDVCTDINHCLPCTLPETAEKNRGDKYSVYYEAVAAAVRETKGEYMKYKDEIAKGYSFEISCGKTENVEEVWNARLPYLKSVESPGDSESEGYFTEAEIDNKTFLEVLKPKVPEMKNYYDIKSVIGKSKLTEGGSVKNIKLAGCDFTGGEIKEMFGLRSSAFKIRCEEECVVFEVKGFGHGVGMSRAGAKYMAENGSDYKEILKYYYNDINLVNLNKNFPQQL